MAMRLQLTAGLEVLEEWSATASQAERNIVYEALFAIGDGSAFLIYDVFGDPDELHNFAILVKADLMVKVCIHRGESFEIRQIGVLDETTLPDASGWPTGIDADIEDP
ncbi:DUF6235 family protein [Amycolatopsis sp. OK19-0408]|uniref:DUF6235 family protein n=1 Tax=Amycolatopsis iheyensis TaxID=2945988 RepID=A0A9X2N719_9PSEU|nr:DUF6235 family protein [Amycolatopsis iheyensis]MCR6483511.1 DUF6235 family protein [Amycolatopsis iheyensis]